MSRGLQQIAMEATDLSKKSIEDSSAVFSKLIGVRSIESAIQIQTDYAKNAYDSMMSGVTRMGDLMSAVAKDAYKPFEGALEQAQTLAK